MSRVLRVQTNAAKLILKKKRRDPTTPLLREKLHWLPIKQRKDFKIATLACKHFSTTLPSYLSGRLSAYTPSGPPGSCSAQLLSAARVKLKTSGERSFPFQVWNSLPAEIRQCPSLLSLKYHLKTCLQQITGI